MIVTMFAALAGIAASVRAAGEGPFRLEHQSGDSLRISFHAGFTSAATVLVDGRPHQLLGTADESSTAAPGEPSLPVLSFSIGIPVSGSPRVEFRNAEYGEPEITDIAPVPVYEYTAEGEARPVYRRDGTSYSRDRFLPLDPLAAGEPAQIRSQRVLPVRLTPFLYNPARRELRRLLRAEILVRFQPGGTGGGERPAAPDPGYESIFRSLLLNYGQARFWRSGPLLKTSAVQDSTREWFETGRTYVRLPIAADGWFQISGAELQALGPQLSGFDTATATLLVRGRPVPLLVSPDGGIGFFGRRNHGDSTYDDFYTDTLAHWLTWGGGAQAARFVPVPVSGITASDTTRSFLRTRHFEKNTDYYEGTGEREVTQNATVAGEGWVWQYYYPNTSYLHTVELDSLAGPGGEAPRFRISLFSTTLRYNTPDHIARIHLNDSLVGEIAFNGRTRGYLDTTLSRSWLRSGSNTLRITSVPTASSPNQFYLDWYEFDYPRVLHASADQLEFTVAGPTGGKATLVTITGFTSPAVEVLDLTRGRRLVNLAIEGDAGSGYTCTFVDTVRGAVRYVAVASPGALPVPEPLVRQFTDIRVNPAGADLIIVTHGNFIDAARQLAMHRGAGTSRRVAVVDVQDVYDEFGFGQIGAAPIKEFLRFAYDNWAAPAPSDVLLFGDASWDPHRYMTTSTGTNFVPAYGVPSGDNWFVCFDPAYPFLPSLSIGRLPVLQPAQAVRLVQKLAGYDDEPPAAWQKRFLFINGGDTPSEKNSFLASSEAIIADRVLPAPIGGYPLRIYKTTPATIDGENRDLIRSHFAEGLLFLNFLGHSGGRIWNVDMGSPNDLQNTNGYLPFVSSVSCNVGAFAEPAYTTLGEELLLADNRGSIGVWASSSLGYASVGATMVNYFLRAVADDGIRGLGALTTLARYKLWQQRGSDFITLASLNLNPLLGDPTTDLALARKPDLVIEPADIFPSVKTPIVSEPNFTVTFALGNQGTVAPESTTVRLTDEFEGIVRTVAAGLSVRPTYYRDSITVAWSGYLEAGTHTITCTLDPAGVIDEMSRSNNSASVRLVVYANTIHAIRPLENARIAAGPVDIVLSSPLGLDSTLLGYEIHVDTVSTFDSPALMLSPVISAGPVGGRWTTPSLEDQKIFFWRGRTVLGGVTGRWVEGIFQTDAAAPPLPAVGLRARDPRSFTHAVLQLTQPTDSGVTIDARPSLKLGARSLGYRANADKDYYSILVVGNQTVTGHWWVHGSSFMALRLDDFTGTFTFRSFNTASRAAEADSLAQFLASTPVGNYVALTVIYDGKSNVNASLKNALRSFGSTLIDSVQPGHSWMLIGRKGASGPGMAPLEHWSTNGVAEDSLYVPNNYSAGSGSVAMVPLPVPDAFGAFSWSNRILSGVTDVQLALVGIRSNGRRDTLRVIPADSVAADLGPLAQSLRDPAYVRFTLAGGLQTRDATATPAILGWDLELSLPPDLAVSPRTIGAPADVLRKSAEMTIPVTVHNIGYRSADSARIAVWLRQPDGTARVAGTAAVGEIPVDDSRTAQVTFSSSGFGPTTALEVVVSPPDGARDLFAENNTAPFLLSFTSVTEPLAATIRVYADGVPLMDGDYVSSAPRLLVQLSDLSGVRQGQERVNLYIDNLPVSLPAGEASGAAGSLRATADGIEFAPQLADGVHELTVRLYRWNGPAGTDSIEMKTTVNVAGDYRILRVYNYPNPFSTTTEFTFVLTGHRAPEELTIRIFTVAGRRIREILVPHGMLQVGFNRVFWDGRDEDGDEVANGYYLYQVQVKGEGRVESAIEKMAKIR